MIERKYIVLDVNLIPMICKNVHGKIVKCYTWHPVSSSTFYSLNLFLTRQEIEQYDARLLDFTFIIEREGIYGFKIKKAFE